MSAICNTGTSSNEPPSGQNGSPARLVFEILVRQIIQFEKSLSESEEIGAKLVAGPSGQAFQIGDISYQEPDVIIFCGSDSKQCSMRLIQHYTQLSVFLIALPIVEDKPPNRIGFRLERQLKG